LFPPAVSDLRPAVQRSERRILTTHAGSLPRPPALTEMFVRKSRREPVDDAALEDAIREATRRVVARQQEVGIDVGNDGEQARESFFTHVQHRMSGFGGTSQRPIFRDIVHFPSFLTLRMPDFSRRMVNLMAAPKAVGEVRYVDRSPLERDCAAYRAIVGEQRTPFVESFMTAPSPGIIAAAMSNEHYARFEDYLAAVGAALRTEYEYIVGQGFVLQLDCPDLAMERHTSFADRPLEDFLAFVDLTVSTINAALANVPADRVRLHVCWGNYEAPHLFDVPLEDILPRLGAARVGALVLSMANPRHAHEHRVLARHPLPAGMLLVAGVIDTTTNYVEHPEVVADRVELAARAVGDPRRVIAGTDCGFETAAGLGEVAEEVVWEKLRALRAGADLATKRLLG
jgi:5-methyltetrahydropteroyltriglutamate--homocysteine methyltransferase